MTKLLKVLKVFAVLGILALLGGCAGAGGGMPMMVAQGQGGCYPNANMIPNGNPPSILTSRGWCPQGSPQTQMGYQFMGNQNQPIVVGQPVMVAINGTQRRCTIVDRIVNGAVDAVVVGAGGYVVERLLNINGHKVSSYAAVGGLLAGSTFACDAGMIDSIVNFFKGGGSQEATPGTRWGEAHTPAREPAPLQFSGEGSGEGVCRLMSDGQARLVSNPSKLLLRGEVVAVSEPVSGITRSKVFSRQNNEDCGGWRRRIANEVIWRG